MCISLGWRSRGEGLLQTLPLLLRLLQEKWHNNYRLILTLIFSILVSNKYMPRRKNQLPNHYCTTPAMFLRKLQFSFSHLVFTKYVLCFLLRQMYFTTLPCLNKNKNYFLLRQKELDERAAPGKCKNIAMQQQIELSLSTQVFFHLQQFRRPVLDYFLTFTSFQGWGELCPAHRVFIHLLISMKFPCLSSFGGLIDISSKC